MDGISRIWFTPKQRSELCERRKAGRSWTRLKPHADQRVPRTLGILGVREEIEVTRRDHFLFGEALEVDDAGPIRLVYKHDGYAPHLDRLHQGEQFEQFIQGPEAAGEHHQRICSHREMEFADRKIVKLERQLG